MAQLDQALATLEEEQLASQFVFLESDEDVHTAIERRVTELAGSSGAKLHTGRSRNDQVATATRLYTRRELANVAGAVLDLCGTLAGRAVDAGEMYLPGYTHLQRAQPVLLAHQLLAHGWALLRDVDRLVDTHRRLNSSPLGAGALGGSTLPLEPDVRSCAAQLGFATRFENSIDAVSDRDFVAEALFDLSLLAVHLSKMGEEVMLYTTEEFGFYQLDDAWATGSSMLPQKKNPDIAELARGKAGGFIGRLVALLTTLKGTPGGYNRDLQEDKAPLFQAFDEISLELPALSGLYQSLRFGHRAAWPPRQTMATSWRSTSRSGSSSAARRFARPTASSVRWCGARWRETPPCRSSLPPRRSSARRRSSSSAPGSAVVRRRTPGGGGIDAVARQLQAFEAKLAVDRQRIDALGR